MLLPGELLPEAHRCAGRHHVSCTQCTHQACRGLVGCRPTHRWYSAPSPRPAPPRRPPLPARSQGVVLRVLPPQGAGCYSTALVAMTDITDGGRTKKLKLELPVEQVLPFVQPKPGERAGRGQGTQRESDGLGQERTDGADLCSVPGACNPGV